jgi:hypothetical protein
VVELLCDVALKNWIDFLSTNSPLPKSCGILERPAHKLALPPRAPPPPPPRLPARRAAAAAAAGRAAMLLLRVGLQQYRWLPWSCCAAEATDRPLPMGRLVQLLVNDWSWQLRLAVYILAACFALLLLVVFVFWHWDTQDNHERYVWAMPPR